MSEARARTAADRKLHPEKYSRLGVPDGMRKADAEKLWAVARAKADEFMVALEAQSDVAGFAPGMGHNSGATGSSASGEELRSMLLSGALDSDEAMAAVALRELCVLALGPSQERVKGHALRLLLRFTKPVPVTKIESTTQAVLPAHDWLLKASEAARASASALARAAP
jgi:hypothetical protein